jgi:hypothetical protein
VAEEAQGKSLRRSFEMKPNKRTGTASQMMPRPPSESRIASGTQPRRGSFSKHSPLRRMKGLGHVAACSRLVRSIGQLLVHLEIESRSCGLRLQGSHF